MHLATASKHSFANLIYRDIRIEDLRMLDQSLLQPLPRIDFMACCSLFTVASQSTDILCNAASSKWQRQSFMRTNVSKSMMKPKIAPRSFFTRLDIIYSLYYRILPFVFLCHNPNTFLMIQPSLNLQRHLCPIPDLYPLRRLH